MDGGKKWKGKPILGKNKTWRGFFAAIIFAVITVHIQLLLYPYAISLSLFDYARCDALLLGILLGAGAILGDALKSFFKRRLGKKPGSMWVPFDQIDFIIGGMALGAIVYFPGWIVALIILVVTPALHFLVNFIAYKLGIKEVP